MIQLFSKATSVSILTAVTLLAVLSTASTQREPAEASSPAIATGLEVIRWEPVKIPDTFEAVGSVRATQTTTLSAQVMGRIVEIRAQEGSQVRQGEILVVVDDSPYRAAVTQSEAGLLAAKGDIAAAESQLELATSTLRRFEVLREKKSVSLQEFDEINARHRAAVSRLEMARATRQQAEAALAGTKTQLSFTRVRAPYAARVTAKNTEIGSLATPGSPLLTLEKAGRFRLEVTVNESEIGAVRLDQSVPVLFDSTGESEETGRVVQIIPTADPLSRSVLVKIELPANQHLRSGLFGRARFSRGERSALLVPVVAVQDRGQLQSVYVLDSLNIATVRYISVGRRVGDKLEVLSGLEDNEAIVAHPGSRNLSGIRVEELPR
jgi:RND family efflux transporter MFP subunit